MKKLFSWLLESNRLKHLAAGVIITASTSLLTALLVCDLYAIAAMCLWTSIVAGVSVEVKDSRWGGQFDLLDILATILSALSFAVGVIIAGLL